MKKTFRKTGFNLSFKVVAIVLIAVLGIWYVCTAKYKNKIAPPQIAIAELSPVAKNTGMGSATKRLDTKDFEVYVTAFLKDLPSNQSYFVWATTSSETNSEKMLLGKMEKSGDIYSLNYSSKESYKAYKKVVITQQTEADAKSGKLANEVLSGEFEK